jgi:hypothetical protein
MRTYADRVKHCEERIQKLIKLKAPKKVVDAEKELLEKLKQMQVAQNN